MTTEPLLRRVQELTRWPDTFLSQLVGKACPTVQAYRLGRLAENLSDQAKAALFAELRLWLADAAEQVDLWEMLG